MDSYWVNSRGDMTLRTHSASICEGKSKKKNWARQEQGNPGLCILISLIYHFHLPPFICAINLMFCSVTLILFRSHLYNLSLSIYVCSSSVHLCVSFETSFLSSLTHFTANASLLWWVPSPSPQPAYTRGRVFADQFLAQTEALRQKCTTLCMCSVNSTDSFSFTRNTL